MNYLIDKIWSRPRGIVNASYRTINDFESSSEKECSKFDKENSSYSSSFENKAGSQLAEMGIEWEVDSTSVEDGMVRIEGYVSTYEVYFELNIDGDDISGSLAGMFDVEGVRVDKP